MKDNGIGMSKEFQTHVFETFTREQTRTVSGIQGTGLGMAIAKNIVDMMGGTISVHSKAEVGTEFIVTAILEDAGVEVTSVKDGIEPVEAAAVSVPGQYDLILMDIQMLLMDGYTGSIVLIGEHDIRKVGKES